MAAQITATDSAFLKAEFAFGQNDIPLSILMKKYALSENAQTKIVNIIGKIPFLMDSPSVKYGRAVIVEAFWAVELCFESKFHHVFFEQFEYYSPELFMTVFQQAQRADTMFQLSKTEANVNNLTTAWTQAQAFLWHGIKKISQEDNIPFINSKFVDSVWVVMKPLRYE